MKLSSKLVVGALCLAAVGGATTASAGIGWRAHHPRRVEVNARLANQNARITRERREGEITGVQARDLRGADRGIRDQERFDASQDGSHITKTEQHQLNQEENGVSQQIGH